MSPISHALLTWVAFERFLPTRRDKALVLAAGVLPDLDGLGLAVDLANQALGRPATLYYEQIHHHYAHGWPAALLTVLLVAALARGKTIAALCAFLSFHLHLICDLLGGRGSTELDLWGIYYFAPFNQNIEWVWRGQWPLAGWQNALITILLIIMTMMRTCRVGYSPLALISQRADQAVVATLRNRFGQNFPIC